MTSTNTARDILWPADGSGILARVAFLYVGQGSSIIVLAANGDSYKTILADINLDEKTGGIDVPNLIKDLVGDDGLDVFVNTHPHDDHLRGIKELAQSVNVGAVWHSGHNPGKKGGDTYDDFKAVIEQVKENGGSEVTMEGSRDEQQIGDLHYYVLAPAEYVVDEIEGEDADARYARVHEQCAVLRLGIDPTWVMITGDADRDAFEKHIADYHKERLPAVVLDAPHHGSRSFFRYSDEDEPYTAALDAISPDYVIVSAPTSDESPHGHPDKEAVDQYVSSVGADSILHTGENKYSFICDIYSDGTFGGVDHDNGKLAESYPLGGGDDGDGGNECATSSSLAAASSRPRSVIDRRGMGAR